MRYTHIALVGLIAWAAQPTASAQQPPPAPPVSSVNVVLKDGKAIQALGLRRDGQNLVLKVALQGVPGAGSQQIGEVGYPIAVIADVEFPEPPQIKRAKDFLAKGSASDALATINPVVNESSPFKDVPGNWWGQAALVKLSGLIALDQDAQAEALGAELGRGGDPDAVFTARAYLAAKWARKGDKGKAKSTADEVIASSKSPEALALAWLARGQLLLDANDADGAVLAYLHVAVYFTDQKPQLTSAILGSAKAYWKLDDPARATKALEDLIADYPNCAEAEEAKRLLAKVQKR